jgi:Respiratory-chain NADH dehydrogenase 51 Kd subunit
VSLLPRLLAGVGGRNDGDLASHLEVNGPLPDTHRGAGPHIIAEVQRSGLRGRGGAGFPVAKKMSAVAEGRGAKVVVANGTEM